MPFYFPSKPTVNQTYTYGESTVSFGSSEGTAGYRGGNGGSGIVIIRYLLT